MPSQGWLPGRGLRVGVPEYMYKSDYCYSSGAEVLYTWLNTMIKLSILSSLSQQQARYLNASLTERIIVTLTNASKIPSRQPGVSFLWASPPLLQLIHDWRRHRCITDVSVCTPTYEPFAVVVRVEITMR